ncbi:MAG: hypothetical protein K2V38_29380, partial [Gemmataceae bacterium]|nr:hypothetical protein [Gemmataceae bacterium]
AAEFYQRAKDELEADKADPLLGPAFAQAGDKLVFLDAIQVGLRNPLDLADKRFAAVRADALRAVALMEARADRPVEAAFAADEFLKLARAPDDLFAAARVYAKCTTTARGTAAARDDYARSAVDALRRAVAAGFRDADAVSGADWEAVKTRAPEVDKVVGEMAKPRAPEKN